MWYTVTGKVYVILLDVISKLFARVINDRLQLVVRAMDQSYEIILFIVGCKNS